MHKIIHKTHLYALYRPFCKEPSNQPRSQGLSSFRPLGTRLPSNKICQAFALSSFEVAWKPVGSLVGENFHFIQIDSISHAVSRRTLLSTRIVVKMKEFYSVLVYLTLFILPNTRRTSGSNVEETNERYKIDGKITIQGFKPAGKDSTVYNAAHLSASFSFKYMFKNSVKITLQFINIFMSGGRGDTLATDLTKLKNIFHKLSPAC